MDRMRQGSTMASSPMIFVTFHSTDNVYAYNTSDGSTASTGVLTCGKHPLVELRGIYLDSTTGDLYVVDGGKGSSRVYLYPKTSSPTSYGPPHTLISPKAADSIDHPFAVAFGPVATDQTFTAYVSNQDTNVVASFTIDLAKHSAQPLPVASYLKTTYPQGKFLCATFVASAVEDLPGLPFNPPPVSGSKGGLGVIMGPDTGASPVTYKVLHSVRDVALANGFLLVVDEADGVVRLYDPTTGAYQGASTIQGAPGAILDAPTHMFVSSAAVYTTFANQIYSAPLPAAGTKGASMTFAPVASVASGSLSGLVLGSDGYFYLANRTEQTILKYSSDFQTLVWSIKAPDNQQPEFLLYVAD
jgi:hypothetical protein